jgi:hypothetical protein
MSGQPVIPINVVHLLPVLDAKLIELLKSLTPAEWEMPTVAKLWKVKDVVAHLLDTNVRVISASETFKGDPPPEINSYQDLVDFLNQLNADWVKAMRRISPGLLITLHELTGPQYCKAYAALDLMGKARFAVSWAGENESKNWMHIAREYTEKFLHQQQIRDAVNKPGLMTRELFYPFIDTFMMALPYTYREIEADEGTVVAITVTGDIGGAWYLTRHTGKWILSKDAAPKSTAAISIDADTAWKLFSKSLRPVQIMNKVTITGNQKLGEAALNMVSVMA